MLTINTNLSSLIVQSNLKTSTNGLNNAIERMTTGFKLNHAKDNAANYSISTSLTTKLGAYTIAEENAMMGLDMVQTASSSLSQMSDLASRLRSLAMQAQSGTHGSTSLDAVNSEANAIVKELFRIQNTTQYNGINLLNGGTSTNIATNAIATLSAASTTSTQSSPRATSSGFIEAFQKRDTSAMTTLASVDENTTLDTGTYSISTAEELAKLATMTNNGKVTDNAEFVLANDIDLSAYRENGGWTPIGTEEYVFSGIFDGNGYKVKNLYINRADDGYQGLFGDSGQATFSNLGIENANITGAIDTGALVGVGSSSISNCYSTGNVVGTRAVGGLAGTVGAQSSSCIAKSYSTCSVEGASSVGGLAGSGGDISDSYFTGKVVGTENIGGLVGLFVGSITNSYATGSVLGDSKVGGLVGQALLSILDMDNCYSTGDVVGAANVGGLVGYASKITSSYAKIKNSYSAGKVVGTRKVGGLMGVGKGAELTNVYFSENTNQINSIGSGTPNINEAKLVTSKELKALIAQGVLPSYLAPDFETGLQIGTSDAEYDKLNLSISQIDMISLQGLSMFSNGALETIDDFLKSINEQQTSLGAVENRLMSVIESIGVNINNLTSTRSTIKDADVAELSSEYIRNQILQQASATLLATANQNPSIALQLI